MQQRELDRRGLQVSAIELGAWVRLDDDVRGIQHAKQE